MLYVLQYFNVSLYEENDILQYSLKKETTLIKHL
jgi:hypothetical protein